MIILWRDHLQQFAPRPEEAARSWIATLAFCTIETGTHEGQHAVEVRLDGQPVGHLTYAMSQRYGELVREAFADGKIPDARTAYSRPSRG